MCYIFQGEQESHNEVLQMLLESEQFAGISSRITSRGTQLVDVKNSFKTRNTLLRPTRHTGSFMHKAAAGLSVDVDALVRLAKDSVRRKGKHFTFTIN